MQTMKQMDERVFSLLRHRLSIIEERFDRMMKGFWPNDADWIALDPHPDIIGKKMKTPMSGEAVLGYVNSINQYRNWVEKADQILENGYDSKGNRIEHSG